MSHGSKNRGPGSRGLLTPEGRMLARLVQAAKYKNKKKIKTQEGKETTIYEYGPRQVANRNKEKAERIEKLRKKMTDLRKKVMSDLDNPAALAIALIDETYERVGNKQSAKEGHFGVTGWKPEHVKFQKGKAVLTYVGKSGVKQKKTVTNSKLVKALQKACDDESCETLVRTTAQDVNEYLKPFDITAKDIRGYHANREMQEHLRRIRKEGPELPRERKDKDKILKEEFKKALEATAKAVGHESSTLKNQYLVPGLEPAYLHDGKVLKEFDKKASQVLKLVGEGSFGPEYLGNVRKDTFAHFTTLSRAKQIVESGKLLFRPPYEKFGTDAVNAVSLTYGSYVPSVQFTHIKTGPEDPVVAVIFKTTVPPKRGYSEEVTWSRDVPFSGAAKIVPASKAISMLRSTPEKISGDAMVKYAGRRPKDDYDREEELVERMVRPAPKKKPPRQDLRNNAPLKDRDKDLEGLDRQDGGDEDLQEDVRRMASRVCFRWLALPTRPRPVRVAMMHLAQKKPGDVWFNEENKKWIAMNPNRAVHAFDDEDQAQAFAKGEKPPKKKDKPSKEEPSEEQQDSEEDESAKEKEQEKARIDKALNDSKRVLRDILGDGGVLSDALQEEVSGALAKLSEADTQEFATSLQDRLNALIQMDAQSDEAVDLARDASDFQNYGSIDDAEELGQRLAEVAFAENVVANPDLLESTLEDSPGFTPKDASKASTQAFDRYRNLTSDMRMHAVVQLQDELNDLEDGSPRAQEINAIMNGIAVAEIASTGNTIPGRPQPSAGMVALTRKMVEQGKAGVMFAPAEDFFTTESQEALEEAMRSLSPHEVLEAVGGLDEDSPYHDFVDLLTGDTPVSSPFDVGIKDYLIDQHIQDMTWNDRLVRDALKASDKTFDDAKERQNIIRKARQDAKRELESQWQSCLEAIHKAQMEGKTPEKTEMDCVNAFQQSTEALVQAQNTRELLAALEAQNLVLPESSSVAVLRKFSETGDLELLKTTTQPSPDSFSGAGGSQKTSAWFRFSAYTDSIISEGPCPLTPITQFGRSEHMPKLITKKGARQVTADLDRLANLFQYNHEALKLPQSISLDLAKRLDTVASHIELVTGLDKSAAMDPPSNYTEEKAHSGEFDPAETGEEQSAALERNPDEPYMDTFKQDEFDQLREIQQTGAFSNAKAARSLIARLTAMAEAAEKKKVADSAQGLNDAKVAAELHETLKGAMAKLVALENKMAASKGSEDSDESSESSDPNESWKTAGTTFRSYFKTLEDGYGKSLGALLQLEGFLNYRFSREGTPSTMTPQEVATAKKSYDKLKRIEKAYAEARKHILDFERDVKFLDDSMRYV